VDGVPIVTLDHADLAGRGIGLVDAPVSGGAERAGNATLAVLLGADDDAAAERASALLAETSSIVFRTGGLGSGHAVKALNNYVLAAGFVAATEALVVATRFGLRPGVVIDVLNQSSGRNVSTETTMVEQVLTGRYAAKFNLGLFAKDLGIAADLAAAWRSTRQ
jgi:3-hydroxyisobutyrate dehydrogenase